MAVTSQAIQHCGSVSTAPFPAACATHQLVRGHCVHVDDL